ncbi:hypothetical protein SLS53_002012 [Cytospora paraplurivora]|uniref:Uncharacterized protein n=1 Tax=Cytospora paraplurivora TaxID=2898453 RepID=A0AAN9YL82_9PEZI
MFLVLLMSFVPLSPEQQSPQYTTADQQQQGQQQEASPEPSNNGAPSSPQPQETIKSSSSSSSSSRPRAPSCSILRWDITAAENGQQQQQQQPETLAVCQRKPLQTPDELRNEIASLLTQREAPPAAPGPSFVTNSTGLAAAQQQARASQRRPLLVLQGLPRLLTRALLDSPLGVDPEFVTAHADGRRYHPRGPHRRTRGGGGGAGTPAHWDYPELVRGYIGASMSRPRWFDPRVGTESLRPLGAVRSDMGVAFCRASLWVAEGADVLFLYGPKSWDTGDSLRIVSGKGAVERPRYAWEGPPGPQSQEGGDSLEEEVLRDAAGAGGAGGCGLPEALEEVAYQHWLGFLEALAPRPPAPSPPRGLPLEWWAARALERNVDVSRDVARRREGPGAAFRPDWEGLTRRLRLRVELLSSVRPGPRLLRPSSGSRSRSRSGISDVSIARRPTTADESGEPPPASTEDNQRSLDRVTYLGGVLLPLSIVSGVLSMNEHFSPGGRLFWVFWVTSIPLAALATLVIYADKLRQAEIWVSVPITGLEGVPGSSVWTAASESDYQPQETRPEPSSSGGLGGTRLSEGEGQYACLKRSYRASWRPRGSDPPVVEEDVVIDMGTPDRTFVGGEWADEVEQEGPAGMVQMVEDKKPQKKAHLEAPERAWRTRRLGWGGAVLSILGVRKPLKVSEGEPDVTVAGGFRRRPGWRRRDSLSD